MAAPPLPPKGGSTNTWPSFDTILMPNGRHIYPTRSQNGFGDNFNPGFGVSQNHIPAPPLPPRPPPDIFRRHSNEINELNRIPPPPGEGPLYRKPQQNFTTSFNNTSSSIATSHTFLRSASIGPTMNSAHPILRPLGFTNSLYVLNNSTAPDQNIVLNSNFSRLNQRSLPNANAFDVQHSKSAPNLPLRAKFITPTYHQNNDNVTTYAAINHNNNRSVVQQSNLEDILKFMKKRSDSNLIDLYCSDHGDTKNSTSPNKCSDDILSMFDPLRTSPVSSPESESSIKSPIAEKSKVEYVAEAPITKSKAPEVSECRSQTVPKQIAVKEPEVYTSMKCSKHMGSVLKIVRKTDNFNKEFYAFCSKLQKLREEYSFDDHVTNPGLVVSPTLDSHQEDSLSIKLIINSSNTERPVSFTCDVNTSIEHIVSHTVCTVFDNASSLSMDNFVLKVHGLSEYFTSHSTLADYEYVHQCHKFDKPVCLTLTDIKDLQRPLARTKSDDISDTTFNYADLVPLQRYKVISYDSLSILIDTLEKEIEKIKCSALKFDSTEIPRPQGVVQAVKAVCTLLSSVETSEITEAIAAFIQVCLLFDQSVDETDFDTLPELKRTLNKSSEKDLHHMFQLLELSLSHLQNAVQELLLMYSKAFRVNFQVDVTDSPREAKVVTDFLDTLLFEAGIVHRLDPNVVSAYESFYIDCEIYHGASILTSVTSKTAKVTKSFFPRVVLGEWLQFDNIAMCTLPEESILYFTLWGNSNIQADAKQSNNNVSSKTCIGWCGIRLFSYDSNLAQGPFLLGLWSPEIEKNSGPLLSNPDSRCSLFHVRLPDFGCSVQFPTVISNKFASAQIRLFDSLEANVQSTLKDLIQKDTLKVLQSEEKELLWEKKFHLHQYPNALPKVLLSAHGWDWACLSDIYSLLKSWIPLTPVDSLHLLMPCFPNKEVRRIAVSWMKDIVSDELCDYLPQIVQILRYEPWDDSPIAWFLLERSLTSVRVAHHLYWLLKQNIHDPIAGLRMRFLLNALLTIAGHAMRERIRTQESLLDDLSCIADKIKTAKESLRLNTLIHDLEMTHHNLLETPTCLPLSPSLEVCGLDVKTCSYFTSNTLPLKLVFHTPEMTGTNNEAIFKVGDDLRQDMITLQMIRIMDKMWLREGLDLKIVTFTCVATELKKGMVEMVPESETLRKIQTELGLTGSFKDRPIAEWLQKYNTSELEYQQAVENFTLSCAGYCVATYILGICDRHNDNIMLKTSGHIFHIDFGKFLGDSQMFGSIKRDRAPFVLTSDMAYVINGGDKPSKKFQYFIDLCCQAFNIVRSHKNIFFNLFSLMVSSGIPGMSAGAVTYIEKALLPNMSETEATVHFTHMIQDSLKSWFTQINFFIHNLAQLRFTGDHNEGFLLSFTSKTYSKETDDRITSADVIGYQKMYDPEKYYIYVVKVERENCPDPVCIFRTYREFIEFHQKLCMLFPLAKFHALPGNPLMGRSNVREVADKRKLELSMFLHSLMVMAEEIAHCDLVYSFFHPLLRDQEGIARENEARSLAQRSRRSSSLTEIHGQVKLSIVYKNNSLFIMVMHAKNLSSPKGTAPDPYVKTYLLPDANKTTKRKTKIVSKSSHPTFMEMLVYDLPIEVVSRRALHVSMWDYDRVQENEFLGATLIPLSNDLSRETVKWYKLGQFNN